MTDSKEIVEGILTMNTKDLSFPVLIPNLIGKHVLVFSINNIFDFGRFD